MKVHKHVLYLASSSKSRQMLLRESLIPFLVIGHGADEDAVDQTLPFTERLQEIARKKMEHAVLPEVGLEGQEIFVLAVDTMGQDSKGVDHGKPKDREDAIHKIKTLGESSTTATAMCLDKKQWFDGRWQTMGRIEQVVETRYRFVVPEQWMDRYLENSWAMIASGAIAVELYGAQFLEWIDGSYSGVVGLPMYELRQSLEKLHFFD